MMKQIFGGMLMENNKTRKGNPFLGDLILRRGTMIGMILIILFLGIRAPSFFKIKNLMDVLKQSCILILVSMGQTIVLVSGGFDMSAGSLLQLTANLAAGFVLAGYRTPVVLIGGLCVGLAVGLINTFFVVLVKIPAFVATLAMMLVLSGATTWYNNGKSITLSDKPDFFFIGQGYIGPIPFLFIITVCIMLLLHVFLKKTKVGMRMYAVGENYAAAMLHGISRGKALLVSFLLGGAVVGVAGVLQASYSYGASTMSTTLDFLLEALAASLLGTTFSKTEELSVIGTAISALFISSLSSALIANGVSNLLQPGLLGLILIVSVVLTVIKKRDIGQVTIF